MIKKRLIQISTIVFLVALVAGYGYEKMQDSNSKSNDMAMNADSSSDLASITNVLFEHVADNKTEYALANLIDHSKAHEQELEETLTVVPTELPTESPVETSAEVLEEKPAQVPVKEPSEAPTIVNESPITVVTIMTDDEAKAKAIVLNNSYRNMVSTILAETNAIRAGVGSSSLTENATLTQVAMFRAAEMANSSVLSHTRPNGLSCFSVYAIYSYVYTSVGENLAWNSENLRSPVEDWKTSEGHYKNMVSTSYNQIGIGVAPGICNGSQGFYYVQVFSN